MGVFNSWVANPKYLTVSSDETAMSCYQHIISSPQMGPSLPSYATLFFFKVFLLCLP